jgi:hypothetical protein
MRSELLRCSEIGGLNSDVYNFHFERLFQHFTTVTVDGSKDSMIL